MYAIYILYVGATNNGTKHPKHWIFGTVWSPAIL